MQYVKGGFKFVFYDNNNSYAIPLMTSLSYSTIKQGAQGWCMLFVYFLLLFFSTTAWGQKKNDAYRLPIKKSIDPIVIDGRLDEITWEQSAVAKDFFMITPVDTEKAHQQSEVRVTYDDTYLYIAVIFFNTEVQGDYNVESLKRDFSFSKNDNLLIAMDPFNNLTTGFSFGLNAFGAQWDGTMYDGGRVDLNWDTKWYSEVSFDNERWIGELAIPFKSIRYPSGSKEWGINFGRLDLKASEKSSWAPVPRQFPSVSLAFTGVLVWDEAPPKQSGNTSIIPYALSSVGKMHPSPTDVHAKIGGDIKYGLSSSLNLDVTVNPDFSQSEVDQQVTNLDRFELFFPEKRQFFLENADLFSNFGYPTLRPFFSRRIGLENPISYGLRLSGNLNETWRIGLMDLQTPKQESTQVNAENFAVLSLQKKVFKRSNIGFILVNKQQFNSFNAPQGSNAYNRNLGIEYNYASSDNIWNGKLLYLKTFDSEGTGEHADGFAAHLEYKATRWEARLQQEIIGENFEVEVGFAPRKGYFKTLGKLAHLFYTKKTVGLLSHGPEINRSYYFSPNLDKTDQIDRFSYNFNFNNRSALELSYQDQYAQLTAPFDPTRTSGIYLQRGSEHQWGQWGLAFNSRPQDRFTYTLESTFGGYYYEGRRIGINSTMGYRFQPILGLSAIVNYNQIQLAAPWEDTSFWLYGFKADLTLTNKLFFTNLYQYNEQLGLWNFNSRFQWRYQPASDIYLVFNSSEVNFPTYDQQWSLTLKINYWLNL